MPLPSTPSRGVNLFYLILAILFGLANLFAYAVWWPTEAQKPVSVVDAPTVIVPKQENARIVFQATTTPSSLPSTRATTTHVAIVEATSVTIPTKKLVTSSNSTIADRISPTTPNDLVVRSVGYNQAVISWSPSSDNRGIAGYAIYQDSVLVGTTIKTIQGFIRLSPSTKYTLGVAAFDSAGNTSNTHNILVTTIVKPVPITLVNPPPTPISVVPNICGNGIKEKEEECDDGNSNNTDSCTNQCRASVCGDFFINPNTEQCDDGNLYENDFCDSTCHDHVPVLPLNAPSPSPTPSPTPTPGTSPTPSPSPAPTPTSAPITYTLNVNSAGNYSPTSLALKVGDSIKIIYTAPRTAEVITVFTPAPPAATTVDADITTRTVVFTTAGTRTFTAKDHNGNTGTVTVQ